MLGSVPRRTAGVIRTKLREDFYSVHKRLFFSQNKKMLGKGLEPSSQRHTHLKRTCIPVPSPQHIINPSQRRDFHI